MSADLDALMCLNTITTQLSERHDRRLSRTVLIRKNGGNESLVDAALNHGKHSGFIDWQKQNMIQLIKPFMVPERSYYGVFQNELKTIWESDQAANLMCHIENTSGKDSKIEGPWTRPDFTLVSHKKYSWTIGHEFDVVTYEVKRADTCNVLAVFEALSHLSVATRAYVVFPVERHQWESSNPAQAKRVMEECLRHSIGLIFLSFQDSKVSYEHAIQAPRREIDHERCNSFLSAVISAEGKDKIAAWKS